MNSKHEKLLLIGSIAFLSICIVVFILKYSFHQNDISVLDVKNIKLKYRYSLDEKEIEAEEIQAVIDVYNSCESYDKVYSEELPCFTATVTLRDGSKLVFVDIHSDESILVERVFFGKTTKYEFYDKNLLDAVKKLIEENFGLHINEVCKKYS